MSAKAVASSGGPQDQQDLSNGHAKPQRHRHRRRHRIHQIRQISANCKSLGLCATSPGASIGKVNGDQAAPEDRLTTICGLDPAPDSPLHRRQFHYDWHWQWNWGNGDLGNQGIHEMDVARWGLGKNEMPRSVISLGGRFGYVDDGQTANTQLAVFDYGDTELIFEVRGLSTKPYRGASVGNRVPLHRRLPRGATTTIHHEPTARPVNYCALSTASRKARIHYNNFVSAVRSRRREDLKADIEQGHLSSALCHLANISYRLGRPTAFRATHLCLWRRPPGRGGVDAHGRTLCVPIICRWKRQRTFWAAS